MCGNSSDRALVTIAVPTYNQQDFIAETLESIIAQDYPNFRVIVSDDASVDGTLRIAEDFRARYPDKVFVQVHPFNLGVTENVRSILKLIEGRYICWFAGDDVMLPGKISKQVALMEANPDAVMSYHDVKVMSAGVDLYNYNEKGLGQKPYAGRISEQLLKYRCFVPSSSMMVRASAVEGLIHHPEIKRASDWLYIIEIAERGPVLYLEQVLSKYRRHPNNLSKITDVEDEERVYEIMQALRPDYINAIEYGRSRLYLAYLVKYAVHRDWAETGKMARILMTRAARKPNRIPGMIGALADLVVQRAHLFFRTHHIVR